MERRFKNRPYRSVKERLFTDLKSANSPTNRVLPKSQFNLITSWGLNGCLIHLFKAIQVSKN